MQADETGHLAVVEVAVHGIPDLGMQALQVVGFGEDVRAHGPDDIAPLGASSTMKWISVMRGSFVSEDEQFDAGEGFEFACRRSSDKVIREVTGGLGLVL